ncbi:MAG TPA: DUF3048 domain-containing protein [Candidatus Saccharimonadales bacterium]|nr:DUF3048 domain-containing protein [Candidatus Saccharimonadales bacterium]
MTRLRAASLCLVAAMVVACAPTIAPVSPVAVVPSAVPSATPTVPSASPSPSAPATPSPVPPSPTPSAPSTVADLTGLSVDPDVAHRLPLAVMIDDSRAARPQSGFNAASIVYQATADGFETRYMLVFQEGDTKAVGPVRSARFFLAQWASELHAALAHYGGDQRTRRHIKHNPQMFTDVDGLGRGNGAYHRIKSRRAPHNAYASTASIRRMALKLGATELMSRRLHLRPFVDPSPEAGRAESQKIRIPYRTNVITYRFERTTNRYLRSIDGKAHIDPADDERVTAANVVVLFQKFRIDTKIEPGHSRPDIKTLGTGKALVFREGRVVKGTWSKTGDTAPTRILDADGVEIPLVRGRTFIQVVPIGAKVSYGA